MRLELLYNPRLLCERLAEISLERRRHRKIRGTSAQQLRGVLLDSLELLELLHPVPPEVIYDVGANIGTWTLLAKAIFPNVKIYAIEPLEAHCREFTDKARGLAGVTLHACALGRTSGQYELHVLNRTDASSLLPMAAACRKHYGLRDVNTVIVPVETLDGLWSERDLPPPDFLSNSRS